MDLTTWENTCQSFLRARQPGIFTASIEEPRVMTSIIHVAQWMAEKGLGTRSLIRRSSVSTQCIDILKPAETPKFNWPHQSLFQALNYFIAKDKRESDEELDNGKFIRREMLVLVDVAAELADPMAVRQLRETLWKIRGTTQTILIIGQPFAIPAEIAPELALLPFELPTAKDIEQSLKPIVTAYKKNDAYKKLNIDTAVVTPLARACAGLTETESRGILGLAIARHEALDNRAVDLALKEKAAIVRRSNILEYRTCSQGLDSVGGCEALKAWIAELDTLFLDADAAASYGLKLPSGFLALGLPGTGKSLVAEALSAHWKIPLLCFDVGKAFSSLVGSTEANVDQCIALANAVAPVILRLDEVEKCLSGNGGESDGGTSGRVTSKLLTWLAEKNPGIFVVATANNIQALESRPELLRAGRLDKVWFYDAPNLRARLEIFAIHYYKAVTRAKAVGSCQLAETLDPALILEAATVAKSFTGAEIEVAVQTAIRAAFNAKPRLKCPTAAMFTAAIKAQKPLAVTMKESINRLRAWCADGRALPVGRSITDDSNDSQELNDLGLPDILSHSSL